MVYCFKGLMCLLSRLTLAVIWFVASLLALDACVQDGEIFFIVNFFAGVPTLHLQLTAISLLALGIITYALSRHHVERVYLTSHIFWCDVLDLGALVLKVLAHGIWFFFLLNCKIKLGEDGSVLAVMIPDISMLSFFVIAGLFLLAWIIQPRSYYMVELPRRRRTPTARANGTHSDDSVAEKPVAPEITQ